MHKPNWMWHMYAYNQQQQQQEQRERYKNNNNNNKAYAKIDENIFKHENCKNCWLLRKNNENYQLQRKVENNFNSNTNTETTRTTAEKTSESKVKRFKRAKMDFNSFEMSPSPTHPTAASILLPIPALAALSTTVKIPTTRQTVGVAATTTTQATLSTVAAISAAAANLTAGNWLSNQTNATNSPPASISHLSPTAIAAIAHDFDHANLVGNLSFFAPAISHVILAPTTHNSLTTLEQDLPLMVAMGNNTTLQNEDAENGDNLNKFYFYETEQFLVLWIMFAVIVLGNSAVLFVMFMNKNRKSRMNYFIKQLALADLSVGLLNVLTDIIWRITISWRAGNVACKLIRFSQVCVTYSSTYVLVAMSIDRYDAITHPMNFSRSWRRARHLVAGAWILSAIFSLPILVFYEEKMVQGQTQCWIEFGSQWEWQLYMSLVATTLFAVPALVITACYTLIVKTIWAKGSIFVPAERTGYGNPATRRASSRGIIPRAKVKTVKMTLVIVIVFIICWSPYIVFDLLQVFGQINQTQTSIAIATFIQSLAPLNSAANPLIYCLFSSTVFRTMSRFPPFKWFPCCCKSYRSNSTQNRCHTVGRRLHNSCDSMRTLTTSLTVSRRSNKTGARVVICDPPKTTLAMSDV